MLKLNQDSKLSKIDMNRRLSMAKKFFATIFLLSVVWMNGTVVLSILLSVVNKTDILFIITSVATLLFIICMLAKYTKSGIVSINRIRGIWFRLITGGKVGNSLSIGKNVRIKNKKYLTFGNHTSIGNGAEFFPLEQGYSSKIEIGDRVVIGDYNRFASMNSIVIEDDVLFAAYVHITDHSHEYINPELPVVKQGVFTKGGVRVCKGSWIGLRVSILSGVTIGEHSVVAAGSIVTKDVPAFSVVAGIPAKVIKRYDFDKKEWVNANE